MSEPITEMDIKNWREYYSEIPEYEMLGRDLFAILCMDTIDALRAELEQAKQELKQRTEQCQWYATELAAAVSYEDENARLREALRGLVETVPHADAGWWEKAHAALERKVSV